MADDAVSWKPGKRHNQSASKSIIEFPTTKQLCFNQNRIVLLIIHKDYLNLFYKSRFNIYSWFTGILYYMDYFFCLQVDFRTNGEFIAEWQGNLMKTKLGHVTCKTLKCSPIKWSNHYIIIYFGRLTSIICVIAKCINLSHTQPGVFIFRKIMICDYNFVQLFVLCFPTAKEVYTLVATVKVLLLTGHIGW